MNAAAWPRSAPLAERLLHVDPTTGALTDRHVADLPDLLAPGDLLVVNDAATLPASLTAGPSLEIRLAGRKPDGTFRAIAFGAGDWHALTTERAAPPPLAPGATLTFGPGVTARVTAADARLIELAFDLDDEHLYAALWQVGRPVQYWYQEDALDAWHIQTAFAGRPWAVEMPSAGRPLTLPLLRTLRGRGVALASLTHAAGLSATGDETLDLALPFPELTEIPQATVDAIHAARRVIAVGTSVVRALEGSVSRHGTLTAGRFEVDLRVRPGFVPRVVDALLTGMHEEGESHFDLLNAFAPRALLDRAAAHADSAGYLCHEFGDSTLISAPPAASSRCRS